MLVKSLDVGTVKHVRDVGGERASDDSDRFKINNLSPSDRCDCPCRVVAAELEGIKLDIVILQKKLDDRRK